MAMMSSKSKIEYLQLKEQTKTALSCFEQVTLLQLMECKVLLGHEEICSGVHAMKANALHILFMS